MMSSVSPAAAPSSGEYLKELAGTNEQWAQSGDYALRRDVSQQGVTICNLRDGNDKMGKHGPGALVSGLGDRPVIGIRRA
jgi:hypothetical protein